MGLTLVELRVRNLGVIDDVTVVLGPGMTALTGETGAGKTLLVEAIGLLLGGRADPSMVRAGADEAVVEGRFADLPRPGPPEGYDNDGDVDQGEMDGDNEIVLARSVVRGGRSKAWVDGRMASITVLTETATGLIELHGQHQHRSLVHTDAQRAALDAFGDIDLRALESARLRAEAVEPGVRRPRRRRPAAGPRGQPARLPARRDRGRGHRGRRRGHPTRGGGGPAVGRVLVPAGGGRRPVVTVGPG